MIYEVVCTKHLSEVELKTGYCPNCDKTIEIHSDSSMCSCPVCGHHIVLHGANKEDN